MACALALGGSAGCVTHVVPPAHVEHPAPVYVGMYGKHSSVLLPTGDGAVLEYAFGDWDWFAVNKCTWDKAIEAMFFSEGSTLGRRRIELPANLPPAAACTQLAESMGARRVIEVEVPRERVAALRGELEKRYSAHLPTLVYNASSSMNMVRDDEHYSVANNCNHLTARWLEAVGCRVKGVVLLSNFEVSKPTTRPVE